MIQVAAAGFWLACVSAAAAAAVGLRVACLLPCVLPALHAALAVVSRACGPGAHARRQTTPELAEAAGLEADRFICVATDGQRLSLVRVRAGQPANRSGAANQGESGQPGNPLERAGGSSSAAAPAQAPGGLRRHRLPPRAPAARQVLVLHGLLQDSESLVCGERSSIVWALASAGMDVWLGDCRGSRYSPPAAPPAAASGAARGSAWRYGYDDIALLDVPAMVDRITSESGARQVSIVGFSQGAVAALLAASLAPGAASKIAAICAISPPLRPAGLRIGALSAILSASPQWVTAVMGPGQAMHWLPAAQAMLPPGCWAAAVRGAMGWLFGWSLRHWPQDPAQSERLCRHVASSAGTALLAHWFQTIAHGGLVTRDPAELRCGTGCSAEGCWGAVSLPLSVRRASVPVLAVAGGADRFVDVPSLGALLPAGAEVLVVPDMEHLDPIWGSSAGVDVFPAVCEFLGREAGADGERGRDTDRQGTVEGSATEGSDASDAGVHGAGTRRGDRGAVAASLPEAAPAALPVRAVGLQPPQAAAAAAEALQPPQAAAAPSAAAAAATAAAASAATSNTIAMRRPLAANTPLSGRAPAAPPSAAPPPLRPRLTTAVSGADVAARLRQAAVAPARAAPSHDGSASGTARPTPAVALHCPAAEPSSDPASAGSLSPASMDAGSAGQSPGRSAALASYVAGALAATRLAATGGGSGSAHITALLLSAEGAGQSPASGHAARSEPGMGRALAPVTPSRPEDAGTGSTWSRRSSDAGLAEGVAGSARRRLVGTLGSSEQDSSGMRGGKLAAMLASEDAGDPR